MLQFEDVLKTQESVDAVNQIAAFLATESSSALMERPVDIVIYAGNAILATARKAFELAMKNDCLLLLSGGIGHSTALLSEAVRRHPEFSAISVENVSEAEIIAEISVQFWGLPKDRLIIEVRSTNCGQNAAFSLATLQEAGLKPTTVAVVQDPTMQRRTGVTFEKAWQNASWRTVFYNMPGFVPRLDDRSGMIDCATDLPDGLWSAERFLSLLTGEVARLRDDESGYGPRGKGFIPHVDVPETVLRSNEILLASLKDHASTQARLQGFRL